MAVGLQPEEQQNEYPKRQRGKGVAPAPLEEDRLALVETRRTDFVRGDDAQLPVADA